MNRSSLTSILCILFISVSSFVLAQQRESITGKLLDAKTQEPIAFASIRIKDRALGIISNTDGSFRIPMKYKEYGDIIEISSMGYQTKELLIHDLSIYELNFVRLQPAILELEEAVITARKKRIKRISPKEIVQKAIDRLLENHPVSPYSKIGYYRDYQLDGEEYVNLNEGIVEVFDQGYKAIDSSTTRISIYDYRENDNFKRDSLARMPYDYNLNQGAKIIDKGYLDSYGGNEFTILRVHNAIRNHTIDSYSFIHRFNTDLLEFHNFYREEDTYIDNQVLYKIRFRKNLPKHSAYGTIYISKYSYAIYKMEYAVYDNTKSNESELKDKNGITKQLVFETNQSYQKIGDKMYLSYISFHNLFKLWETPKFKLDFVNLRFDKRIVYKAGGLEVKKRWIVLRFNQNLNADQVRGIRGFNVSFKGKKVSLDGLLVSDNEVILYPKQKTRKQIQLMEEIEEVAKRDGLSQKTLVVKIPNLKDINGNVIGNWSSKYYNQFREFFVQQIKPNKALPYNGVFMNKNKPIFENQPMVRPDNFDDYWMNTPLQKVNN